MEEKEKPTLKEDLKKIGGWLKNTFKEPTTEELKQKIELSKLKTELAKTEIERKEINARRWEIGGKL